jgi:hypothetical protein
MKKGNKIEPERSDEAEPVSTVERSGDRDETGRFLTGNSGGGRKKGSRSRINEKFLTKLEDIFDRRGDDALEKAVTANPMKFIQLVAGLLPARLEARLEGMIEHRRVGEFRSTDSIDDILELVAHEVGIEKAIKLAELLEVQPPDSLTGRQTLLPPKKEICPYPEGTTNYRDWYRRRYGVFPG